MSIRSSIACITPTMLLFWTFLILFQCNDPADAWVTVMPGSLSCTRRSATTISLLLAAADRNGYSSSAGGSSSTFESRNFLLEEFQTYRGEIINPYKVLKIRRTAERAQIKESYRNLSRRYHPDSVRHRDILPGNCNNLDDVRDQWERIKLAYEILSDTRRRKRYDRHEALSDPGAAVKRAAVNAAVQGISGVGKGIFDMGAFAFNSISKTIMDKKPTKETTTSE